jgi:peptidoglycan/xylan/chitin deacetylase (PgdA/CDA1 family)
MKPDIILTFDLEELVYISRTKNKKKIENINTTYSVNGCNKILNLLNKYKIKSTFFTTGYFANLHQDLIANISNQGHEIACHSYFDKSHKKLTVTQIRGDIQKSKTLLEKITNKKVIGFRMPQFSIFKDYEKILQKLKFSYDSSIHPAIVPGYYYNINKKIYPYKKNKLTIIPISVIPVIRMPISWIWCRNLGFWLINIVKNINKRKNRPLVIYFHTWEFTNIKIKEIGYLIKRNTGNKFLQRLDNFIRKNNKNNFKLMKDII